MLSNVYIQHQPSQSFAYVHSCLSGGKCAKQSLIPDLNQCLSPVSECDASQVDTIVDDTIVDDTMLMIQTRV